MGRYGRIVNRLRAGKDPFGGSSFTTWYKQANPNDPNIDSEVVSVIREFGYQWPPPSRPAIPASAPAVSISPAIEERLKATENLLKELQPQVAGLTKPTEPMSAQVKARMFENVRENLEPMQRELERQMDESYAKSGQAGTQAHKEDKRKLQETYRKDLSKAQSDIELQAVFQDIESDIRSRDYTLRLYNTALDDMMAFLDVLSSEQRYEREFTENLRRYETETALTRQGLKQKRGESRATIWGQMMGAVATPLAAFLGRK